MLIRETHSNDLEMILAVEKAAFEVDPIVVSLVSELLNDPSAQPSLSLLAFQNNNPIGHILFSKVKLENISLVSASILAPLAVIPSSQNQGIGSQLVQTGLDILSRLETALVFVLGSPAYYARFGFQPAQILGFDPTYPILDKNIDAWMVKILKPNVMNYAKGKVICANALNKPDYWTE